MESENHRYVPIDTSHQGQYVDGKDPCSNGSHGDCGGVFRSHGCATRSNEALLLEDIFHLERIDQVSVTFSDTHLVWHSVEDDIQNLVIIVILHYVLVRGISGLES